MLGRQAPGERLSVIPRVKSLRLAQGVTSGAQAHPTELPYSHGAVQSLILRTLFGDPKCECSFF